jgi:predicted lipoprotein with Yx(FWY)xxD motif
VTRDDGSEQLAYDGMPLYYWVSDTAPGDTTGHEVGDVWFVAAVGEPDGM